MRTIIDLPEDQIQALHLLGKQKNKSRAALIREAVTAMLQQHKPKKQWDHSAFGMWKDKGIDGLEYQRALRREWDEREAKLFAPYRKEE